jgi:hypothetical protein
MVGNEMSKAPTWPETSDREVSQLEKAEQAKVRAAALELSVTDSESHSPTTRAQQRRRLPAFRIPSIRMLFGIFKGRLSKGL